MEFLFILVFTFCSISCLIFYKIHIKSKIEESIKEYLYKFEDYQVSNTFENFIDFYFRNNKYVASGFHIYDTDILSEFCESDENDFTKNELVKIGFINHNGSTVAFWNYNRSKPLTENPIVYLGDDGYICVIGRNFHDLLRILTIDNELDLDSDRDIFENKELRSKTLPEITYFDLIEKISRNNSYLEWLNENTALQAVDNSLEILECIIKPAMAKYQDEFLTRFKY